MTPKGWKIGAVVALVAVVGLSLFGGRTYVSLREAEGAVAVAQEGLQNTAAALVRANLRVDSLKRSAGESRIVYRERTKALPPDTVLVGLPAACDACVERSKAQDLALAAADSTMAWQDQVISAQDSTLRGVRSDLFRVDSSLTAARQELAEAGRQERGPRRILGITLPEVMAGYGLSFVEGQIQTGPVLALGWRVRF